MIPFQTVTIWSVFEGLTLLFLFFYLIFSLMVLRQIQLMNKTLVTGIAGYIKILGLGHFMFSLVVLLFTSAVFLLGF